MGKAHDTTPIQKGSADDCSEGPFKAQDRRCTDPLCCLLYVLHWGVFFVVAGIGLDEGDPAKLVIARDYQGNYCGKEINWMRSTDFNLKDHGKLYLSMNTTAVVDDMAKQLVCGSAVRAFLVDKHMSSEEYEQACGSSLPKLLSPEEIEAKASQYSDPSKAAELLKGSGSNILGEVTKYFNQVCASSCHSGATIESLSMNAIRTYTYQPSNLEPWAVAWQKLIGARDSMPYALIPAFRTFEFEALPLDLCPYHEKLCVPFPGIDFTDTAGRCTPQVNEAIGQAMAAGAGAALDGLASSSAAEAAEASFGTMVGDLQTTVDVFIIVCVLSLVIGFVFLIVLRYTVGIVVWTSIILTFCVFMIGGCLAYMKATQCKEPENEDALRESATAMKNIKKHNDTQDLEDVPLPDCMSGYAVENEDQRQMLLYSGYVLFGAAALWLLFILCMCQRIRLAVAINKVAADFMGDTKAIIFVPVVQVLISCAWLFVWAFLATYIISQVPKDYMEQGPFTYEEAVTIGNNPGKCMNRWPKGWAYQDEFDEQCNAVDRKCYKCTPPRYVFDQYFAFAFFSLLWNNAFLIALGQIIIAGACAGWYFTPQAAKGSRAVIKDSVHHAFLFHTGSLAFGSFILAVVQFIKWWMYYLKKQAEANKNAVLEKVFACLQYIIHCFERLVEFLNKNAYIQIAILGKDFCASAWNAFCLIIRNAGRIGALGMIGGVVHLIGTFFIMSGTAFIGYHILGALHADDISSPVVPTILYVIVGYASAKLIMNVFGMSVDTILQCFVANEEVGGSKEFTPGNLRTFLVEHKPGVYGDTNIDKDKE